MGCLRLCCLPSVYLSNLIFMLYMQELHPVFDIHCCGSRVIKTFKDVGKWSHQSHWHIVHNTHFMDVQ